MILEQLPIADRPWEICIIGSGPIGMSLAFECERLGQRVLMLESGGREIDPAMEEASHAEIVDPRRHAPMELAVVRALGGTSWMWGGRCVPYDPIDFAHRPWVPYSDWPITYEEVEPWYAGATEYMSCGGNTFYSPPARLRDPGPHTTASFLERWSTQSRLALLHRGRIERSESITLCLNSTVIDLDLGDNGGAVDTVTVATPGGKASVKARFVIVAAGGVETARLLFSVQRRWPGHFGAVDGPLGRYYMGHISGKIASIVLNDPAAIADLDFERDACAWTRRRFMLTAEAQQESRLLNTAFWPDNPPFHDPRHRSGVLSGVFLALAIPPIGRRLIPEPIRLVHVGPKPHHIGAHLRNAVIGAPGGARDILNILRDRFLTKPRKPGFIVRNSAGKYALHYHAEQEPSPLSRVVPLRDTDRFGLPRVSIDFRFTDADARSVIESHRILDADLRASGVGRLEYWHREEELFEQIMLQAADGYHQAGTTRMGRNARDSVVDPDLKVHDVANLYLASSSVFPTAGQANSTLLGAALAVRLAHHLNRLAV